MALTGQIETSKRLSALRQIHAAISHFHNLEYECSMTLAAAAEGQLPETDRPHLFQMLKRHASFKTLDVNLIINWLKHPFLPQTATISQFEVAITLIRAVTKFGAAYGESSPEMKAFAQWTRENGLLAKETPTNSN